MSAIWNTIFYQPLYNGLIFLTAVVPWHSAAAAVIILTIVVRVIIFPFAHKSIKTQRKIRELEPEVRKIKEQHADKETQAKKTMELYKKHGTSPFSGCLPVLIQLPVFIALFLVFRGGFGENTTLLYSFVHYPPYISADFFGIDLHQKSYILAIIVGLSQYFYSALSVPKPAAPSKNGGFQEEFARSMNLQARYVFPVIFTVFSMSIPSAVALYWVTSNMFSIAQELFVRRQAEREKTA